MFMCVSLSFFSRRLLVASPRVGWQRHSWLISSHQRVSESLVSYRNLEFGIFENFPRTQKFSNINAGTISLSSILILLTCLPYLTKLSTWSGQSQTPLPGASELLKRPRKFGCGRQRQHSRMSLKISEKSNQKSKRSRKELGLARIGDLSTETSSTISLKLWPVHPTNKHWTWPKLVLTPCKGKYSYGRRCVLRVRVLHSTLTITVQS